jgi:hypothetical protein
MASSDSCDDGDIDFGRGGAAESSCKLYAVLGFLFVQWIVLRS